MERTKGSGMKALTIYQPWGTLIIIGAKPHEFRHWDYSARFPRIVGQRIVIHASARAVKPAEVTDLLHRLDAPPAQAKADTALEPAPARELLKRVAGAHKCRLLPLAAGLGTAVIGKPILACDLFKLDVADSDRGNFNWAWPLTDIKLWDEPIHCRGLQGFWDFPFAVPS